VYLGPLKIGFAAIPPQKPGKNPPNVLRPNGSVRFSYNPSFSARFFSQNSVFLSQQISHNSVSTCFFSEATGPMTFSIA